MSETATIDTVDAPAETAPESVEETTAPETTETPFEAVDVKSVKVADAIETGVKILNAATENRARRAELDANAYEILAKHLVNQTGTHEVVTETVDLPAYGEAGKGSLRYTKQRAQLLKGLADANALGADLRYNGYKYPNENTGRRQYFVQLFGAQCDVERVVAMFYALQTRAVRDAYDTEIVPTANLKRPVDQTKARREWMTNYATTTGETVDAAFQAVIDARPGAGNKISDRETAAMAALEAFKAEHATATAEDTEGESTSFAE